MLLTDINFFLDQGALTHGDRRATESRDLSRFNFDNKASTCIAITGKQRVHSFKAYCKLEGLLDVFDFKISLTIIG